MGELATIMDEHLALMDADGVAYSPAPTCATPHVDLPPSKPLRFRREFLIAVEANKQRPTA